MRPSPRRVVRQTVHLMPTMRLAGTAARPHAMGPRTGSGLSAFGADATATLQVAMATLRSLAGASSDATRWSSERDIARARNAHRTNTIPELRMALASDSDWFEGDVRMHAGRSVMAHDAHRANGALSLRDWIEVGAASGRGLKLDFKDVAAIDDALRMLRAANVPAHRIIFNVAGGGSDVGRSRASLEQLRRIRATYPDAIINLDPGSPPYDAACIARVVRVARQLGGRVMFPLDARAVTRDAVRELRQVGRVAVWNDPRTFDPGDIAATTRRMRALGIDGMIDLRPVVARGRGIRIPAPVAR